MTLPSCPAQFLKSFYQNLLSYFLSLMATFSHRDFFGDPIWPQDFTADHNKLQPTDLLLLSSGKKSAQNIEPNQNSSHSNSIQSQHSDPESMQKFFLINEQKMLYSNLKHSEITYLEDHQKAFEFSKDDLQNSEKLSDSAINGNFYEREIKEQTKIKFESEYLQLPELNQDLSESDSQMIEDQEYKVPQTKRNKRRPKNLFYPGYDLRNPKIKKEVESENSALKIESVIKQEFNGLEKISKMEEIQAEIMRKLQGEVDPLEQLFKKAHNFARGCKTKVKTQKYKILTQAQKEYLVYLSTLTTTCEVARRFNISVNNICRWKKGTMRKVGAGRKIVNQELEEKVIAFVREKVQRGQVLWRKQIQMKAKELSGDKSFKASKGWFERFYSRNINIFSEHLNLKTQQ